MTRYTLSTYAVTIGRTDIEAAEPESRYGQEDDGTPCAGRIAPDGAAHRWAHGFTAYRPHVYAIGAGGAVVDPPRHRDGANLYRHGPTGPRLVRVVTLDLTAGEADSLAWIGDRYGAAGWLYDHGEWIYGGCSGDGAGYPPCEHGDACPAGEIGADPDGYRVTLAGEELYTYTALLDGENGLRGQRLPACTGGTLAAVLDPLRDIADGWTV